MEAPRGVEPTGTNGREATHIHTPARVCGAGPGRAPRRRTGSTVLTRARSVNSNTNRVHCPVPEPPHAGGKPRFPADNPRFAAAMAQERRPVPFRTRKLRPGTAMVLHPTGCGRVARRRTTRTGSPSEHTPQGAFPISGHPRVGVFLASLGLSVSDLPRSAARTAPPQRGEPETSWAPTGYSCRGPVRFGRQPAEYPGKMAEVSTNRSGGDAHGGVKP